MTNFLATLFICLLSLRVVFFLYRALAPKGSYEYKNPAHRICKKCQSIQMQYETANGLHWEVYRDGKEENCNCIKDTSPYYSNY